MKVKRTIPLIRIFDEAKARAFYVDWLGFSVDWEHRFEEGLRCTCKCLIRVVLCST